MKDLRRYLVLKYIQYLVLSSPNAASVFLGLLGSAYTLLVLQSARVSSKSSTVLIASIAKADILVCACVLSDVIMWTVGANGSSSALTAALQRSLRTANTHISCVLLSCLALEAYLITFFPAESRRVRTVRNARRAAGTVWMLVTAECVVLLAEDLVAARSAAALLQLPGRAAALLRSLSYFLGIFLRIVNVYFYYKIFFSMSNR
ncbi:GP83B protein, partial [Eudromia elegans]|nr:GP83B protein [Eudromia elegans]